ncbi:DUF805 domain-containing protein [Salinicoccus roseus]|jgi:uncharacterized membrane protein YhaH (DUF805 family)|uniref:DUF805 domain-containing protein n=1 Tax=Salinicoccus roseus TaxID=45670 RepID=UPI000F4E4A83|nr:DUF805 domain-containing protein [Salinicoccus roseus]RPE51973.1 uncharacterized membrane protein YhaH (DUF805 family) [Salinicoccus roseus]GGA74573.1 membrane protein [Salinicoccus roseus]
MFTYFIRFFKKAFQFRGRATRGEYWIPNLILAGVGALVSRKGGEGNPLEGAFTAVVMIPSLSVTSRRYQDAGITGWYQVIQMASFLLIPLTFMKPAKKWMKTAAIAVIAGVNILGLVFSLMPSDGDNKYGRKPIR